MRVMESDDGKVFVGGISWETDEGKLREHFGRYGEVTDAVVMRDRSSGRPRGFAFVVLSDPSLLPSLLQHTHVIDGRTVEVKQALSRGEQHASARSTNPSTGKLMVGRTGDMRTKKIFVGGLPSSLTEEAFRQYFEGYGAVTDVVIMFDQSTQRPRGFGFISFNSEDAVDRVLHNTFHELDGKLVEVKRALPKEANPGGRSAVGSMSSQPFGSSNANAGSYNGRADGNRYMQQQVTGGGYPSYGVPGYGFGAAGGAVGYCGYGMGGGYSSGGAGYGGPSGSYGHPTAGGYVGGPVATPRSPWSGQLPSGYGPGGYGLTSGYATTGWSGPTTGSGNFAPGGRLPRGTGGYGSQGYGYGGYGARDGQHQGAYGAVGGRGGGSENDQGAGSTYNTGGYGGDTSGAVAAYPNTWGTEPQQGGYAPSQADGASGGPFNYGSYGSALPMHSQQQ